MALKFCLTVYIETLVFYYLLLEYVEEYIYFSNQCLILKKVFKSNVEK